MASVDLLGPIPRKPRRIMMHAVDIGQAPGMMPGWTSANGGKFVCRLCGHDAGWLSNMTETEIRRGVPCPVCNEADV